MADRHKNPPLRFRPPEPERLWLLDYQQRSGKSVNRILTEAVRALQSVTSEQPGGGVPHDPEADRRVEEMMRAKPRL